MEVLASVTIDVKLPAKWIRLASSVLLAGIPSWSVWYSGTAPTSTMSIDWQATYTLKNKTQSCTLNSAKESWWNAVGFSLQQLTISLYSASPTKRNQPSAFTSPDVIIEAAGSSGYHSRDPGALSAKAASCHPPSGCEVVQFVLAVL